MEIEGSKTLACRYIELWNTGDGALADEILAPTFVDHTQSNRPPGSEGVKEEITISPPPFLMLGYKWNR